MNIRDAGDVVRRYFNTSDPLCLEIIDSLGEKTAEFQSSTEITKDAENFHVGVQHGDFNAGNILVNNLPENKKATFSLIDNVDFSPNGRLIADLVYFTYFNTIVVPQLSPDSKTHTAKMNEIVQSLYAGYVRKMPEETCREMKEVFLSEKPLSENIGPYSKHVLNANGPWGARLDEMQKKAFIRAFNERFPEANDHVVANNRKTVANDQVVVNNKPSIQEIYSMGHRTPSASPSVSNGWLRLDPQQDMSITKIDLSRYGKNLKHIDAISKFTNLKECNLSGTSVEDLSPLKKLQHLEKLKLSHNPTLSAIEPLKDIKKLKELDLSHTGVVWVGPLGELQNLQSLNLSHTPVNKTESEIEKVQKLTNLKNLNLDHTKLSTK